MNSVYLIYDQAGEFVNRIVATEDFCKEYCADHQYTYERAEEQTEPEPAADMEQRVAALEESKADRSDVDALAAAVERGLSL